MLVNLTANLEEIGKIKELVKEQGYEYTPQSDPCWLQETGIYQCSLSHNFQEYEFLEKLDGWDYNNHLFQKGATWEGTLMDNYIPMYGVADNIEQIKSLYKKQIDDPATKWVITLTPVSQNKEKKGKKDGWRWHKWGSYIGILKPQCEYIDDENFGEDFQYVICFHLYKVL
jgi:hypothetical protein